jgi:outer membrane murein-binding lipoprotein Lpp
MNNIDRYIQKAVKRELACRRGSSRHSDAAIRRRRIMDSAARHIRYNDGIQDLFAKVKDKITEAINSFKRLPAGRKVAAILGSMLTLAGSIFAAKNLAQMSSDYKRLSSMKSELESSYEALKQTYASQGLHTSALSPADVGTDYDKMKMDLLGQAIKSRIIPTVVAIVGAFLAFVGTKIAKAQKSVSEGANEREVVAEVIADR